jgi:hypothetical protein
MSDERNYEGVEVKHYGANTQITQENTFINDFKCWAIGGLWVGEEKPVECELGAFSEGISWQDRIDEYVDVEAILNWGVYIGGLVALLFVIKLAFGKTGALIGYVVFALMIYVAV